MKFAALIAVVAARALGEKASNEDKAWDHYLDTQRLVGIAQKHYVSALMAQRNEERTLQREVDETKAQEKVVAEAEANSSKAGKAVNAAHLHQAAAWNAYLAALSADKAEYTK